jgi:ribosomal protein S15P/S13E
MTFDLDEIIERAVYISSGVHRIVTTEDFAAMVERIEDLELHLA